MNQLEFTRLPQLDFACNEAMNTLATNLFYCGDNVKTVMLTSRYADEGKSFLTLNLMRTLASLGKNVVLVDTDLRRSRLVSHYGVRFAPEHNKGLAHYLAGICEMDEVVYQTNIPNAYMVPIGREVESSLQLLSSNRMGPLMEVLAQEFDIVVVDTPPVGVIVDGLEMAKYCTGALLVVSANRGHKKDIAEVTRQIKQTGCPVLGAVLNNVEFDSFTNRKYYYKSERYSSYYYGAYGEKK
ncbi:MAG: CpsD/CapB family tyrosine-protein kinase [Clostridia bacterium]|nr:CpsD/CapB family tyrosine-protein kinase [Clostridia bacterium]